MHSVFGNPFSVKVPSSQIDLKNINKRSQSSSAMDKLGSGSAVVIIFRGHSHVSALGAAKFLIMGSNVLGKHSIGPFFESNSREELAPHGLP
jgi:hypothetical protein